MSIFTTQVRKPLLLAGMLAVCCTGCATTTTSNTARTGNEQILISSAIDRAMSSVRFNEFANYSVFIDDKYLDGTVDKGYLVGTLRHKVLQGGGRIAGKVEDADVVLEPRSGGVGTDSEESYIGIPAVGIPGLPFELPEVKFAQRSSQIGTAKIGLVCYDAKTGAALGRGGDSTALTHANDTYVLGIGPFRSGSVVETRESAIGFNGVGGSLMGAGAPNRRYAVSMVQRPPQSAVPTPPAEEATPVSVAEIPTTPIVHPASAIIKK